MEPENPWMVVHEPPQRELALGAHGHDVGHRAIVVGLLPVVEASTPQALDSACRAAAALAGLGADAVEVSADEAHCLATTVAALQQHVEVPIVARVRRSSMAVDAVAAGAAAIHLPVAGLGDSLSGLGTATVVLAADPTLDVRAAAAGIVGAAERSGLPRDRVVLHGVLGPQSDPAAGLRAMSPLVAAGWTVGTSIPPGLTADADAHHGFRALAVTLGCRVLFASDVRSARRTASVLAAVAAARNTAGATA